MSKQQQLEEFGMELCDISYKLAMYLAMTMAVYLLVVKKSEMNREIESSIAAIRIIK